MKKWILCLLTIWSGTLFGGCGESESETETDVTSDEGDTETPENDAASCDDGIDNDGDGAVDCEDDECAAFCADPGDVSGMPVPPGDDNVPKPDGDAENLKVLDWAGFKAAVSFTFDDSQPSQMDHYDELQAEGIRMTFFAGQGFGGSAAYDELWSKAVEDGHEIGNHTAHHCHLTPTASALGSCDAGTALNTPQEEITSAADYFAAHFGQEETYTMASPYGDSGWSLVAGDYVFLNRSVNNGVVEPNGTDNPLNLPARMAKGEETVEDLNAYIDPVYEGGNWLIYCFHSILPTSQNWYAGVDIESITGNIEYVKEKGDMWADTMENVGAYWLGQKVLNEVTPADEDGATVWTWTLPDHFPPGKYLRVTVDGGTLKQGDAPLPWSKHGYYEVALDEGELTLSL